MKQVWADFLNLFFPEVCMACGNSLYRGEKVLCTKCLLRLPRTHFHHREENPVAQLFWGRVAVSYATSFFYFRKNSKVQHLMHQFKYAGRKEVGSYCGQLFGIALSQSSYFSEAEYLIPVPLHPQKERKRGYNQSELIAKGMAQKMNAQLDISTLFRSVNSATQTKKNRYQRFENMDGIFRLKEASHLKGKHLVLVDDVVTTGSTLESCASTLLQIPDVRVSVATLACAI
ncbi:MAG: amidophosphoribosyltransferase [Bacteroidetes bacterium]|nr:MAG: amidophosphoribosyltransferase [Bacteroidota bacterium]PIE88149.1 MAG: amidophosphoribosyltransferase [Bacteroidota bacterium]